MSWIRHNFDLLLNLLIQTFIAYHVFYLSKQLSSQAVLEHKGMLKKQADEHISKIRLENRNHKVHLVNIKTYFSSYPSNNENFLNGYDYISAEIKSTRFDGIEFVCGIKEVYRDSKGKLTFNIKAKKKAKETFDVFEVGLVPYSWIEYIDLRGDEFDYVPQFFCKFKGKRYWQKSFKRFLPFGYPYAKIVYYIKNKHYRKDADPSELELTSLGEEIKG